MSVNEKVAIEHGLKADEYENLSVNCSKELLTLQSLEYFQLCGMSIALINLQDFI